MIFDEGSRSSPLLRVSVRSDEHASIVSLDGELDMAEVDYLNDAVSLATRYHPALLLVDLRGLVFMDSTGLKSLLDAQKQCRARGCRFVLVRGGRTVQRLFEISGIEGAFEFVDHPGKISSVTDAAGDGGRGDQARFRETSRRMAADPNL